MNEKTVVDFIAAGESPDEWKMVLVEEGPWSNSIETELRRIQERLYGCIDAALDGQLAEQFPQTLGKQIVLQLDCYNVPRGAVEEFFARFSQGVFSEGDYQDALQRSPFVKRFGFEINFDSIH